MKGQPGINSINSIALERNHNPLSSVNFRDLPGIMGIYLMCWSLTNRFNLAKQILKLKISYKHQQFSFAKYENDYFFSFHEYF